MRFLRRALKAGVTAPVLTDPTGQGAQEKKASRRPAAAVADDDSDCGISYAHVNEGVRGTEEGLELEHQLDDSAYAFMQASVHMLDG